MFMTESSDIRGNNEILTLYSNDIKIDNENIVNNCNDAYNFNIEKNDFDLVSSDEEENKITCIQSGTNKNIDSKCIYVDQIIETYQENKESSTKNNENNFNN